MMGLRRREDRRTLFFVAVSFALTVGSLFVVSPKWPASPLWGLLVLLQICLAYLMNVVNHNHLHCPTFRLFWQNRLFDGILSITMGHPVKAMTVPHMMNHHVENGTGLDWCDPEQAGQGWGFIRLARYTLAVSLRTERERRLGQAPTLSPRLLREFKQEGAVIALYAALALFLNWKAFLLLNLLPWLVGLLGITGVNLLQHDRCPKGKGVVQSRDFVGKFGNWLLFNNGYHSVHHLSPGTHWSELPALHRERAPAPELEERSVWTFLLKEYLVKA